MNKEEILKKHTQGFEMFPMTPRDERDMLFSMIYSAMDDYAENKEVKLSDVSIEEKDGKVVFHCPGDVYHTAGSHLAELISDGKLDVVAFSSVKNSDKKSIFKIDVVRDDDIEAFGAYAESSIKNKEGGLVLLNVESCVFTGVVEEVSIKEMLVETLMHEIGHALEDWYDLEFDEDRIEKIIKSYKKREKEKLKP